MPIEKKVVVGAINITTHPHSKENYVKLLKAAQKVGAVTIRGSDAGMLCHVSQKNYFGKAKKKSSLIYGEIYKFTNIELDGEWFHTAKELMADENDIRDIEIPEELKPNAAKFSFYFYPEKHILFYEGYYNGKKLTPFVVLKFFDNLFSTEEIVANFGKVEVTHIPDMMKVDEIINAKNKEMLKLTFTRPNPDSLSVAERKFLASMNKRKVAKIEQEFKSIQGENIEMDEELIQLSRIAAKNGELSTKVANENGHKEIFSTTSYPFVIKDYFDINVTTNFDKFASMVDSLISNINKWLK